MFKVIVYFLALIALVTGAMDLLLGVTTQYSLGQEVTDPLTDNVFRFFAAIWFGLGLQFIFLVRDLARYRPALMLVFAIVVLAGFGRVISLVQYGMPSSGQVIVYAGLIAELVIVPILMVWLARMNLPEIVKKD